MEQNVFTAYLKAISRPVVLFIIAAGFAVLVLAGVSDTALALSDKTALSRTGRRRGVHFSLLLQVGQCTRTLVRLLAAPARQAQFELSNLSTT